MLSDSIILTVAAREHAPRLRGSAALTRPNATFSLMLIHAALGYAGRITYAFVALGAG